jgi:pyrroloquinoline quinone biosynthesis protein B
MGKKDMIAMSIKVTVLGTAQDGGYPQVGCFRPCCEVPRKDHTLVRFPVALGIIGIDDSPHLIEASRTMAEQFELWHSRDPVEGRLASLSITHAHLGHIDGLGLFGREAMAANDLVLNCSESLCGLIKETPTWNLLLENHVITPRIWRVNLPFTPSENCGFTITPIPVPHRNELSDNHALVVDGGEKRLLFMPDHDTWQETLGDSTIREWLSNLKVDIALIDGTFWQENELPHRDMRVIPHPTVKETLGLLGKREEGDPEIYFTHLNHTNPLQQPGMQRDEVTALGWNILEQGQMFNI